MENYEPPMLPYQQKEMHFFSEKEANVSVNDVPLCYWYTFVHAHVKGKTLVWIKIILYILLIFAFFMLKVSYFRGSL